MTRSRKTDWIGVFTSVQPRSWRAPAALLPPAPRGDRAYR